MRTSYNRDIKRESQIEEDSSKEPIKNETPEENKTDSRLAEVYIEISSELNNRHKAELYGYEEALNTESDIFGEEARMKDEKYDGDSEDDEDYEDGDEEDEETPKKSKKKVIIPIVITSVVVLGVVGMVAYKKLSAGKETLNTVETRISKLYTSKEKVDIKSSVSQTDLNEYYMELLEFQGKGKNVDGAIEELDTIGYYINDKSVLQGIEDSSYDLTTVGMKDTLDEVKAHTKDYTVSGLAVTINNTANGILEDYNDFINLRQELNGVTDVLNFDESKYTDKIDAVSHEPNKMELDAMLDKLVVDKQAEQAQKDLQEAEDEKAKEEAEIALQEAQELQKKTQDELESLKKTLEEQAKKALEEKQKAEEEKKNQLVEEPVSGTKKESEKSEGVSVEEGSTTDNESEETTLEDSISE